MSNQELYMDHMSKVAEYVKTKYDVQPIMWDDMLRKVDSEILKKSKLAEFVEPMVWAYQEQVRIFIASTNDSDAFNGPIYILNVQGTLLI